MVLQRRFAEESSGLKRKLSQAQELLDQMTENEDPDTVSAIERCGPADRFHHNALPAPLPPSRRHRKTCPLLIIHDGNT